MPKGQKLLCVNETFTFTCSSNNLEREFTTEKERDIHIKRHQKICKCLFKGIGEISDFKDTKPQSVLNIKKS